MVVRLADLAAQVVPRVHHGEQDPFDAQRRIEIAAHAIERLEQAREPLERVVLALERDQHAVRRRQGVEGEQPERRRAVDQHEVVVVTRIGEGHLEAALAVGGAHELDLGAHEVDPGRDHVQVRELGAAGGILDDVLPDQRVIDLRMRIANPEGAGRVPLGVEIDQQRGMLGGRQRGGQIHRSRGLSHPTLLVGER
jgi:hypothetical protein